MRVLYVSYNGLGEPLGRSQVLPYVRGLADAGHAFTIVSFEKERSATTLAPADVQALLPAGTRWIPLRYHQRPTVPATAFDVVHGALRAFGGERPDLVHARGTVSALVAWSAARRHGAPWLFDVRGLLAQEYVDGGRWPAGGLLARTTQAFERRLLRSADGLVFLTRRGAEAMAGDAAGRPLAVIPCAVDLDRFRFRAEARARVRAELVLGRETLAVYSGSLGSWYLPDRMLEFVAASRDEIPDLHLLVLTPQREIAERSAETLGLAKRVRVRSVSPTEVPDYLSAADFGISFIAPSPSKVASSPTKLAEYLACGLPAVLNAGVGDAIALADEASWVLVDGFDAASYTRAARRVKALLARPDCRAKARDVAARRFSLTEAVSAYDRLYGEIRSARSAR
jgi:glycosyltransferase involved in cell wall biosynthesis